MNTWYELHEVQDDHLKYAVLLAEYNHQLVIVKNKRRGGWEIPGGNREPGEMILDTASRELFEETGAVQFDLTPLGIYQLNDSYGMIFHAKIKAFTHLPAYEMEERKLVDELPDGLNFGDMFYRIHQKWKDYSSQEMKKYSIDLSDKYDA